MKSINDTLELNSDENVKNVLNAILMEITSLYGINLFETEEIGSILRCKVSCNTTFGKCEFKTYFS